MKLLPCLLLAALCAAPLSAEVLEPLRGPLPAVDAALAAADGRSVWIVQLKTAPAVQRARQRQGGQKAAVSLGQPSSQPSDRNVSAVAIAAGETLGEQATVLANAGISAQPLHSYSYVFNGFAARLTGDEAARLRNLPGVRSVFPDQMRSLATNSSPGFLELFDPDKGLVSAQGLSGEDIVIGVIDSGITPESASFADTRAADSPRACQSSWGQNSLLGRWLCSYYRRKPAVQDYEPLDDWAGECVAGERFETSACNNKLIGARFYSEGSAAVTDFDEGEFLSPRDADGHGTHIAATAAGNRVSAILSGSDVAKIRGIAPRARIAAYKACWLRPGATRASCAVSDLVRAIDDAVADGVDIINYSVGNTDATVSNADDVALLNATKAGVLAVVAAGNDGPLLGTIGSPAGSPWTLTVAASSRDGERFVEAMEITAPASISGRYASLEGAFTPALSDTGSISAALAVTDDNDNTAEDGSDTGSTSDACQPLINADEIDGAIALIPRGGCDFSVKISNAQDAGALAVVIYNNLGGPVLMLGDGAGIDIPAVAIGQADGQLFTDTINDGNAVNATLANGLFLNEPDQGNLLGRFSSRGPSGGAPDILKPDVSAPGINILAAYSPDVANGVAGQRFAYLTGTSMAAPHVAGSAALLLEANPDWSPSMLRSALMTSARRDILQSDGTTDANPFDIGAGHIVPNDAFDPGLVYATSDDAYDAFACAIDDFPIDDARCSALEAAGLSGDPSDLNQPSIAISRLTLEKTVRRTLTATSDGSWNARLLLPQAFTGDVVPATLNLSAGESVDVDVTIRSLGQAQDLWYFGALEWVSDERTVYSPIAFRPVQIAAPRDLSAAGGSGDLSFDVSFGYTGSYDASLFGFKAAGITRDSVDQDPSRTFTRRTNNGVTAFTLTVPPDQLYLRMRMFDAATDGDDDLDIYLYYCPTPVSCRRVGESTGETSEEQIDIAGPAPGRYEVYVHGFDTDDVQGGPGANFEVFTWLIGTLDTPANSSISAPNFVSAGGRESLTVSWRDLQTGERYLGLVIHSTPSGPAALTLINVDN